MRLMGLGIAIGLSMSLLGSVTLGGSPALNAPTGREATYTIAASDAPIHVKAQADFVTDGNNDQVEILAAISLLPPGGGSVHLSGGTFYIGATINITTDGVALRGVGVGEYNGGESVGMGTRLLSTAAVPTIQIGISGSGNPVNDTTIERIFFDGNILSPIGTVGIRMLNLVDLFLADLVLRNFTDADLKADPSAVGENIAGIYATKVICGMVKFVPAVDGAGQFWANRFVESWLGVVRIGEGRQYGYLADITFADTWFNALIVEAQDIAPNSPQLFLASVYIEQTGGVHALRIDGVKNAHIANSHFSARDIRQFDYPVVYIDNARNITFTGNTIESTVLNGIATRPIGLYTNASRGFTITGNVFKNLRLRGVHLDNTHYSSIASNVFSSVGQGDDVSREALRLGSNSSRNSIVGNTFEELAAKKVTKGIYITSPGSNNNILMGNVISPDITVPILDGGTGTTKLGNDGQ